MLYHPIEIVLFMNKKIVRERLGFWNYGYQKNWTKDELENVFSIEGFLTQYIEIDKGIGNFRFIDKMDKLFSTRQKREDVTYII